MLEINEQYLLHPQHLREFLGDTLPHLPPPDQPRPPFHYKTLQPVAWNQVFPLLHGSPIVTPDLVQGFGEPESDGIWTVRPDATLMFGPLPPEHDVRVSVDCHAAKDADLPGGERNVDVFINDEPVGAWAFRDSLPTSREAVIPRNVLAKGRCVVRLHFREPLSSGPAPGFPADEGQRGLYLNSICFRQVEELPYWSTFNAPGVLEARNLSGFMLEAGGMRADHQDAALHLPWRTAATDIKFRFQMFAPPVRTGPVFVSVNDNPVGIWSFDDVSTNALCWRELMVPKRFVVDAGCTVRFHVTTLLGDLPVSASSPVPGFLVTGVQTNAAPDLAPVTPTHAEPK